MSLDENPLVSGLVLTKCAMLLVCQAQGSASCQNARSACLASLSCTEFHKLANASSRCSGSLFPR